MAHQELPQGRKKATTLRSWLPDWRLLLLLSPGRPGAAGVVTGVLLALLLLGSCTNVRPTHKIGLLAPFEGLHRRSGYAALSAVRAAIADFPSAQAGILPLALDDGGQPQTARAAARKLLVDARLVAVVGPLSPDLSAAAQPLLDAAGIWWSPPYALVGEQWAAGLVAAAAAQARQDGAAGLVLAGWTPGWPALDAAAWTAIADLPVRLLDDPEGVGANEAVFWLGSPDAGAAYLVQLRRAHPLSLFVMGPAGEDPVFAERAGSLHRVYWTIWTDDGYNRWTASHDNPSPNAYLVYRTTLAALAAATGVSSASPPTSWTVQTFRYDAQGSWTPALP